jgi:hypothetical protein
LVCAALSQPCGGTAFFAPGEKLIATDRQGRNNSSKSSHVTINHLEKKIEK